MRICKTLNCLMTSVEPGHDAWVFAYGSLIWRPDVPVAETRTARVTGYHRGLYLWSRQYRGTQDFPGLVLALDRGGACTGLALRIAAADVPTAFPVLWERG
jgi:glutathione-specific gamma-glutamylcyclotransferase